MAFDVQGALAEGYTPHEIAKHLGYDYNGAINEGYTDNEILSHLGTLKSKRSVVDQVGSAVLGGVGAAVDFVRPANLAVSGAIEGSKLLSGHVVRNLGKIVGQPWDIPGTSLEEVSSNITGGKIPGTGIDYAALQPSTMIKGVLSQGMDVDLGTAQAEYNQANMPLHKLTQAADVAGTVVNDITGSPTLATATNLGLAGLALHGINKGVTKISNALAAEYPGNKTKQKMDQAKQEYEQYKADQEATGNSFAAKRAGFTYNPKTSRMERGTEYIDPLTNQIRDVRKPVQGSTTERVDTRFEQKDVDTTNARYPYPLEGIDTSKINTEYDSVSGKPIFTDTIVDNSLVDAQGNPLAGHSILKSRFEKHGIDERYINPNEIARLWFELSPEKKARFKNADEFQNFVELHEHNHSREASITKKTKAQRIAEIEEAVNNLTKEDFRRLRNTAENGTVPTDLYSKDRQKDLPNAIDPATGEIIGYKPIEGARLTKEELRESLDTKERKLEDVIQKINDYESGKTPSGTVNIGGLHRSRAYLEQEIDRITNAVGRNTNSKARPSNPILERFSAIDDGQGISFDIFKDKFEEVYQQLRNDGKTHDQAVSEITNSIGTQDAKSAASIQELKELYNSPDGIVDMNMGIPITKKQITDFIKSLRDDAPTLKEFAAQLGATVNDKKVQELYEKNFGKSIEKMPTPEETAIAKIDGLKETVSPELQPLEQMIPRWELETDVSSGATGKALRENLSSGGRMTAMRTGSTFIDWNVENILGETRKAQVIIKEEQQKIKSEVNKLTGGLLSMFKDKGAGEKVLIDVLTEMFRVEGKSEMPNISKEGMPLYKAISEAKERVGLLIQEEAKLQGIDNFKFRSNYLAGVFFGPYRSVVKDANGTTLGVVTGRTKAEAVKAIDFVKEQFPDAEFAVPKYNPKYDGQASSLGARYGKASEVLELMRNQSESAAKFMETMSDYYAEVQSNYMGYKQHLKDKRGVFGSEGNRPWVDAKNNALDLLEAQLGVIDHSYHWLAEQKIARDMDKMLTNKEIVKNLPESIDYVNMYLDHAFGRLRDEVALVDTGIEFAAKTLGISGASLKEMSSVVRNTALVNTLGASGGFILTQFVQVPTTLAIAFGKAKDMGIGGNKSGSMMIGTLDLINGLNGKIESMSKEGRYYFEYFKKVGALDAHLVEHTIHRKIVNTVGMSPIKKAIWETTNGLFKGAELTTGLIGKLSIEKPESWTRGTFAMTMAHFYRSAGYSMHEAAVRADKDTSSLFVDYSPQERSMIFQRMGEAGKFASTVSTFKLNNLNQWFTFGKKQMYGALAMLALTTWFTTGINGIPFMDETEFGATYLKSKGVIDNTPKEWLLQNSPDLVSFGPLSQALTPLGGPAMAVHRKFSQSNVIPDDFASFIYPLMSFYTNKVEKTSKWVKSGFAKQEGTALLREMVPGNLKFFVDAKLLTNENGLTLDTNTMEDINPTYVRRSSAANKLGVTLGIPTQDEWKSKQIRQLDKIAETAWKEHTGSKVASTISAFDNKDREKFSRLFTEAVKYNPQAKDLIVAKLTGHAKARNMSLDQALDLQFAKGATTMHGVDRFKKYQNMKENR